MKTFRRHGDLNFDLIKKIPKEAKETKDMVLAYGEHTGHCHLLTPIKGKLKVFNIPSGKVIDVEEEAEVTHQEHKPIRFTRGKYRMWYEQEYDPFQKEIERVQD